MRKETTGKEEEEASLKVRRNDKREERKEGRKLKLHEKEK